MGVEHGAGFSCLSCGLALANLAANDERQLFRFELQQGSVNSVRAAATGDQIKAPTVRIKANIHPDPWRSRARPPVERTAAALLKGKDANRNPSEMGYRSRRRLDEITEMSEFNFQVDVSGALMTY